MPKESMRNRVRATRIIGGNADKEEEDKYREVLREHGINKHRSEILTKEDLRQVFIYMQEDMFVGM
jgi:hypothetical protein